MQCLLECLRLLVETPLCFPRFLFQTMQTTTIKLAVSPQPRVAGEPVTSTMGAQLAVKVEGIVQVCNQKSTTTIRRKVKAVQVTVATSQPNQAVGPDGKVHIDSRLDDLIYLFIQFRVGIFICTYL